MTRLVLIRHGQSTANKAELFVGQGDAPLTELGHRQAAAAAVYLRQHERIDKVYASDLSRAMDTARPTAEAFSLPVCPNTGLREIFAGVWEGMPKAEVMKRYPADRSLWYTDLSHALCTGGESVAEVYERTVRTVTRIAMENQGKTVLIASHWTPVIAMVSHAMGYTVENIGRCIEPINAALQILQFENGVFRPETLNITDHLNGILSHPKEEKS